jgi:hypothetical protein
MGLTTRLGGDILGAFFSKRSGGAKPMGKISRRQLLQRASAGAAFATLGANASYSVALPPREVSSSLKPSFEWIRSIRLMIAEGYAPAFYPSLDYEPEKALEIARRLLLLGPESPVLRTQGSPGWPLCGRPEKRFGICR